MWRNKRKSLSQNFIFYLAGILVVLGIKYYYSQADCDSLKWILAPTTRWVELLSGISFSYISGTGYVNHSLRLLIAPSCSGVQFMIITAATLIFSFVHSVAAIKQTTRLQAAKRLGRGLGWIAVSVFFAWLFTVFVNGLRIIVAIYLPIYLERAGLMGSLLTPDRLHTMIGVAVYFTALLTIYRLVGYLVQIKTGQAEQPAKDTDSADAGRERFLPVFARRCMPPVFWYFCMTLGLPFLNRAYLKGASKFTEFALLVLGCMAFILLIHCLMLLLGGCRGSLFRTKKQ